MSGVGNLKVLSNPITQTLNQDSTFPVTTSNGVAAVAYNYDTTNLLVVDFTLVNDTVISIEVPPGTAWEDIIQNYKLIEINGSSLSGAFIIHVKEYRDAI